MNRPSEPTGRAYRSRFRMDTGLEVLEQWADGATQSEKNAIYKVLFAVMEGSVFQAYQIVEDYQRPNEFFVLVRKNLVLKVRVNCFDSFGIVYVGPRGGHTWFDIDRLGG